MSGRAPVPVHMRHPVGPGLRLCVIHPSSRLSPQRSYCDGRDEAKADMLGIMHRHQCPYCLLSPYERGTYGCTRTRHSPQNMFLLQHLRRRLHAPRRPSLPGMLYTPYTHNHVLLALSCASLRVHSLVRHCGSPAMCLTGAMSSFTPCLRPGCPSRHAVIQPCPAPPPSCPATLSSVPHVQPPSALCPMSTRSPCSAPALSPGIPAVPRAVALTHVPTTVPDASDTSTPTHSRPRPPPRVAPCVQ